MDAETLRRIGNIVALGTVSESKSVQGISLARVKIAQRVTDFLPIIQRANSFKRQASPVRVGEQVVVLFPFGEGDFGVILGSLFNKGAKEPSTYSDTKEIIEFEDGTIISYDSATSTLELDVAKHINIVCKSATVQADVSIDGTLSVSGNITTGGTVTDTKGDLTNFSTTDGAGRA